MYGSSVVTISADNRLAPSSALGSDAVSYSSVIRYFRDDRFASSNPASPLHEQIHHLDHCDQAMKRFSVPSLINHSHPSRNYQESLTSQQRLCTRDIFDGCPIVGQAPKNWIA
jgi:hypothetical protein